MGRLALVVIALAGCRQAFGIDDPVEAPDAGSTGACSAMSMLADDFANGDLDAMWPIHAPDTGTITEANGVVTIDTSSFAILSSSRYLYLREDSFSIAITDNNTYSPDDQWALSLDSQHANYGARIVRDMAGLHFYRVENGFVLSLGSVPYDPVAHRYLKIAEIRGFTNFETSPDNITYLTQAAFPIDDITFVRVSISVTRSSGTEAAITVDDANHGTPIGTACPIAQLQDDFSAAMLDDKWARSGAYNGTVAQHDGVVELAITPNGTNSSVFLYPSTWYDAEDGSFAIEIGKMIDTSADVGLYFSISGSATTEALFQIAHGMLAVGTIVGMVATTVATEPFDATKDRWLRYRNANKITYWESSGDGVTWTIVGQVAEVSPLDRAEVAVQIAGMTTTADSLQLDNVK